MDHIYVRCKVNGDEFDNSEFVTTHKLTATQFMIFSLHLVVQMYGHISEDEEKRMSDLLNETLIRVSNDRYETVDMNEVEWVVCQVDT